MKEAKEKILAVLTLILKGDKLAADYLLISLVSRVYNRQTGMLLGNVPVNISNLDQ